ncbi:hypothetical protein [Lutimonas vermicola]|uniref:Uncharacterized protein n=1 Tax=Lutimonas vermicola TaxID=414288 RepID=A0ABU9L261_9FLAO
MNRLSILAIFLFLLYSCSDDSSKTEQAIGPQNIQVDIEIKGAHDGNLFGDGSGVVYLRVKAENTNQFKVIYEGTEIIRSTSEYYDYGFYAKEPGIHEYELEIQAINTKLNLSRSQFVNIKVNKIYPVPENLFANLMVGNKKWRIDTSVDRPVTTRTPSGEVISHTVQLNEKYDAMYDDTYKFGYLSLIHETNGHIVGNVNSLSQDFGAVDEEVNDDNEYEDYPLESYSASWMYSPSKEGWNLHMSDQGFIGSYVGGDHVYEIMWHSKRQFMVRTIGADGNYWHFLMTSE